MEFTKSSKINGKFKMLNVANGVFVDSETGEIIPVSSLIEEAMGDTPFDLTVSATSKEDITPEREE